MNAIHVVYYKDRIVKFFKNAIEAQRYVNVLLFKEEHLMQGSWKGHISSVTENNGLFAEMYPTYNEDYKIRSYDVV